jgi:hypothetical protein
VLPKKPTTNVQHGVGPVAYTIGASCCTISSCLGARRIKVRGLADQGKLGSRLKGCPADDHIEQSGSMAMTVRCACMRTAANYAVMVVDCICTHREH